MKRSFLLILLVVSTLLTGCSSQEESEKVPVVEDGVLDLREHASFPLQPVELGGQWEFTPDQFLEPGTPRPDKALFLNVPGKWDDVERKDGRTMGADGFGTYRLRLLINPGLLDQNLALRIPLINTAGRFFVNGREVATVGQPGKSKAEERPLFRKLVRTFPVESETVELMIHVSNHSHRDGGLKRAFVLGDQESIQALRERALFFDFFLFGWLLVMSLYHFGLFLSRREDRSSFAFSFVCLVVGLRILFTGENYITEFWPDLSFEWRLKFEYISYYAGTGVVMSFFAVVYGKRSTRPAIMAFGGASVLFVLHVLLTSTATFTGVLIYFHAVTFCVFVYCLVISVLAVRNKAKGSLAAVFGGSIFIASVINDMLFAEGALKTGYAGPLGLAVFIIAQSYALSILFSSAFESVRLLSRKLRRTNAAYSRFVPREFLTLLQKNEITEIQLGDQVQREMTMLFTDIRSFTPLSETMTPQENFNFLNSYLKRMTPVVLANGGIIDKYIGDSIMALFSGDPAAAIEAAVQMQREIREFNDFRNDSGFAPIQVGMGIHTGEIMLGTIGAADRMEGTVISDDVNLASRVEGLTKTFGVPLIISESTRNKLASPENIHMRFLGEVQVKGKQKTIRIYEVMDGLPEAERMAREKNQALFDEGIEACRVGDFEKGEELFRKIQTENPGDGAARWYLDRCIKRTPAA